MTKQKNTKKKKEISNIYKYQSQNEQKYFENIIPWIENCGIFYDNLKFIVICNYLQTTTKNTINSFLDSESISVTENSYYLPRKIICHSNRH